MTTNATVIVPVDLGVDADAFRRAYDPDECSAPDIDISALRCSATRDRMFYPSPRYNRNRNPESKSAQPHNIKVRCKSRVVFRVFAPNGDVFDFCNNDFNRYFEKHEIAAEMVMRLSDDEEDFVPSARRGAGAGAGANSNGNSNGHSKPLCQVPRPMPKRK